MSARPIVHTVDFSAAARLTSEFYSWEQRGRGWALWPERVDLEPAFRPFAQLSPTPARVRDDARRPTALSLWLDRLFGRTDGSPELEEGQPQNEPEPREARPIKLATLQVILAPEVKIAADIAEHFLLSLSTCSSPVSYEVIGAADAIVVQLAASTEDVATVREQLQAHFPDAVVTDGFDAIGTASHWTGGDAVIIDFGLSQEFMRPIRRFSRFDADPLLSVTGALSDLAEGEIGVVQVLFQPTRAPWRAQITRAVTDWNGQSFFEDAPGLDKLAHTKVERPLFAAIIRVAATSSDRRRSWAIAKRLGGTFPQFADPASNELIALDNTGYPDDAHMGDLLDRQSRRSGMLLNSEELVSLVHPPSTVVRTPRLKRDERRTKQAPKECVRSGLVLGTNTHAGFERPVALTDEQRSRHVHVVGASGTGKSTLLVSLIAQDLNQGKGVCVLDPHGDLIDEILCRIPSERADDLVLIDPADSERPVGINILTAHSELEKTLLASDLVAAFRRLSTSWGDQMTSVLSNAILAFLESSKGGSLADLRRFLVEADYRKAFLETVNDEEVVYYWQKEFPLLQGRPQAPLLTRLDAFLRPQLVRRMVTQPTALDFSAIMNDGKILLVKLAQGAIGEENASLLGSFFVAKLTQLVMGRQSFKEVDRRPFYLYVDEFQHFVTPSMATMLTSARKYRLGLTLAHQELRQLMNQDRDVAGAVLANAATRIVFRVGDDDAKRLEDGFTSFSARDLMSLGRGQAVCRTDRADWDFSLSTTPLPPLSVEERERGERLSLLSRQRYGRPFQQTSRAVFAETIEPAPIPVVEKRTLQQGALAAHPTRYGFEHIIAATGPESSPIAGRGGSQHKYIQELIKRWADANGWRSAIEKQILDGLGHVDILLESDGFSVACEIGVSTSLEHELQNVHKCLSAGFTHVISVIPEPRKLKQMSVLLEGLGRQTGTEVLARSPEDVFAILGSLRPEETTSPKSIRGYRVSVGSKGSQSSETAKRSAMSKVLTRTLLRLRR